MEYKRLFYELLPLCFVISLQQGETVDQTEANAPAVYLLLQQIFLQLNVYLCQQEYFSVDKTIFTPSFFWRIGPGEIGSRAKNGRKKNAFM